MTKTDKIEPASETKVAEPQATEAGSASVSAGAAEVGTTYLVQGGPIAPWGNGPDAVEQHGEKARMYDVDEVVSLPNALAKHYNKLNRLKPFIAED